MNGPILRSPMLYLAAEVLDDLEHVLIANQNRLRQLTRPADEKDADGIERGFGLTAIHPDVMRLQHLVDGLEESYKEATRNLQKTLREHPLHPWIKATAGVGEKQAARLLAAIGDPYWNDLHDRPRTVSELWAFCGYHVLPAGHTRCDTHSAGASGTKPHAGGHPGCETHATFASGVAPKRRRGQRANWSSVAKTRAYLIAERCMMMRASAYRHVYDDARAHYADAVHQIPCERCGPAGKPAQPGSALNPGHQHARGLRAISKALLKDLWIESKRLHELRQESMEASTPKAVATPAA